MAFRVFRAFRATGRLVLLCGAISVGLIDYLWMIVRSKRPLDHAGRAEWLRRQARLMLKVLAVEPVYHGQRPGSGLLVCNHLGYLDILVLAADAPLVFVSKDEVAHWPVFGLLTRLAGTLFIRRERRADVVRVAHEMSAMVASGAVVAFFPEGTSSGGADVLPFRPALFAPAVKHQWRVTPAAIRYRLDAGEGSVEDDIAYWGEMTFVPHLLGVLSRRRIRASVRYGRDEPSGVDRQELAVRLCEQVGGLLNSDRASH